MTAHQNIIERIVDKMQQGEMSADEGNVQLVRAARVKLVTSRIPAQVRKALNAAVKSGELAHMKKSGNKPEAYYHPTFEYLANGERATHERKVIEAIKSICK